MPDVWPVTGATEVQQEEYSQKLAELRSLSVAITSLRKKQTYYQYLLSLVEETLGDPTVNLQPNIVTKTGPITDELRKMRTLLAKITYHLNKANLKLKPAPHNPDDEDEQYPEPESWDELRYILSHLNDDPVVP